MAEQWLTDPEVRLVLGEWSATEDVLHAVERLRSLLAKRLQTLKTRLEQELWWSARKCTFQIDSSTQVHINTQDWGDAVSVGISDFTAESLFSGDGAQVWIWVPPSHQHLADPLRARFTEPGTTVAGAGRGLGGYITTRRTGGAQADNLATLIDAILDGTVNTLGRWIGWLGELEGLVAPDDTPAVSTSAPGDELADHIFVEGEPPSFLTPRENPWKEQVRAALARQLRNPRLQFVVSSWKRGCQYFDLDNIAKPVLDVIGIEADSVWVSVTVGEPPGVVISEARPQSVVNLLSEIHIAQPPTRSIKRLPALPELAGLPPIGTDEPLGVGLAFSAATVRVGDFGFEGPIKSLIDAMGPVLGTYHQGSADYRIRELRVTRGIAPSESGVTVGFWLLEPTDIL